MTEIQKAIKFVAENVSAEQCKRASIAIDKTHYPLRDVQYGLAVQIYDLMEEYGEDHDLPEGWWLEYFDDEEEVFYKVLDIVY